MRRYERFNAEEMILRDHLAIDRTVLANERTVLSYARTALAFAGAGAALIHFLDSAFAEVIGWVLIPLGAGIFGLGVERYLQMRRCLGTLPSHTKRRVSN